jgi:hypothetical protein
MESLCIYGLVISLAMLFANPVRLARASGVLLAQWSVMVGCTTNHLGPCSVLSNQSPKAAADLPKLRC